MKTPTDNLIRFTSGTMKLEIHPSRKELGTAAANAAAEELRRLDQLGIGIGVIFATGASQFDTLATLTSIPGLPWNQVRGFHMDEYLGLDENHPASFRRYLREKLTQRVAMREFHRRIPDYEIKPGTELTYTAALRSVESLPLTFPVPT